MKRGQEAYFEGEWSERTQRCRRALIRTQKTVKNIAAGLLFQRNQNCVKEFFQELQSKRIYRVAGGYIVRAWVILRVAAIVFPSLELPSWTMKVVLDVLLLGFAPALLGGGTLRGLEADIGSTGAGIGCPTDVRLDYVGSLQNAAIVVSRLHRVEKRLVFCD